MHKNKLIFIILCSLLLIICLALFASVSTDNIVKTSEGNNASVFFTGKISGFSFLACMDINREVSRLKLIDISKEKINDLFFVQKDSGLILFINENTVRIYDKAGKEISKYAIDKSSKIISSFATGLDKPEEVDIILLTGKQGEKYGRNITILLFDASLNKIKVKYTYQFKNYDIWKVQAADVDGDKKKDISFGAYKKTPFHPVLAKRPFIFNWEGGGISPKWLGSRLSMPFDDYIFQDVDKDGMDELISIEINQKKQKLIRFYKWDDFGFKGIAVSKYFEDISDIKRGIRITGNKSDIIARVKEDGIWKWIILGYNNNKLTINKVTQKDNLLYILK